MSNAPPSINPADEDSLQGVLNTVLRKFLMGVDDMLPAKVISYDRDANRATVQPIVAMLTTDGSRVARAQLASVPVFQMGGGGHMLSFNLKPGDLGWIKASDRDISLFMQSYAEQPPNTRRLHSFEDGLFFPDAMRDFTIQDEDAENAVFQTLDGRYRVALWEDRVKVTAGDSTTLEVSDAGITLTGPTITLAAPVITIGGIVWQTHKHTGVVPGGGNTGGPTP